MELCFAVLLPIIYWIPSALYLLGISSYALWIWIDLGRDFLIPDPQAMFILMLLGSIGSVVAAISTGLLILYGSSQISGHPRLRGFMILSVILGLMGGVLALVVCSKPLGITNALSPAVGIRLFALLAPMAIWLKYLLRLLRGTD